jgi:hypothetical protein
MGALDSGGCASQFFCGARQRISHSAGKKRDNKNADDRYVVGYCRTVRLILYTVLYVSSWERRVLPSHQYLAYNFDFKKKRVYPSSLNE